MNLITFENICKSYSEKKLIENLSFGINDGEKIGLIGINGTGKSTLLKIVAGAEDIDSGKITKANRVRIEYLPQSPDYDENATVLEQVFKAESKELNLLGRYQDLLKKLERDYSDDTNNELIKVQEQIDTMNLWDLENDAKSVLTKLGIDNFDQKVSELSGGQKKRISLASALITPCELLVLDEPTNHLDSDTIDWLEEYLNNRKGSLLMITHDRYFLDRVTNRILELDKGRLFSYEGNYTLFLEKKMERLQLESSMEDKRQNLIRNELKWVKRGARARTTKQKARLQRFDELINKDVIKEDEKIDISVASSRLGKKIIEIKNISKSFDGKKVIDDLEYTLARTDRIGIVGKNGLGKSTLINILNGKLEPDTGSIEIGETVKMGCFSQDDSHMDPNMKAIDYIKEESDYITTADGTRITASMMCERFLFNSTLQYTLIEKLSGGERRRLHLLRVLMGAPNVLLLDEPTNDLDIETLKRLEDYLDEFDGVVITVSHDRYFLDRICNKIFAYEGNGRIFIFTGNYSDYSIFREIEGIEFEDSKPEKSIKQKKEPVIEKTKVDKKTKFSYKEQKEFDSIDSDIEQLEKKISALEESTVMYATDFTKLQEIMNEKAELEKELEYKYERWEYLNELADSFNQ
ncbi:ABC-F family ATP-binding cassette domain-containing protein [Peptacetobacter sp.]|uniref:ABC-F family ATP-binding cassette domain-containing protein n=1 Tax=Peptacetobacter sp. TaxID=2991975 RepID=UPI00261BDE74|nr:ABC-F family ATP-binding cassette domain-containing protein [Peptacetobacter sp.]